MLMKRQACAGLPFEEASQLARFPVFVKHFDLDSFKLRRRPFHLSRIDVYGATDRRLLSLESRVHYRLAFMGTYPNWKLIFVNSGLCRGRGIGRVNER